MSSVGSGTWTGKLIIVRNLAGARGMKEVYGECMLNSLGAIPLTKRHVNDMWLARKSTYNWNVSVFPAEI